MVGIQSICRNTISDKTCHRNTICSRHLKWFHTKRMGDQWEMTSWITSGGYRHRCVATWRLNNIFGCMYICDTNCYTWSIMFTSLYSLISCTLQSFSTPHLTPPNNSKVDGWHVCMAREKVASNVEPINLTRPKTMMPHWVREDALGRVPGEVLRRRWVGIARRLWHTDILFLCIEKSTRPLALLVCINP